ncbi:MAG: hypothetical protein ACM3VZ_05320 [Acidobacteriota bacterium]
MTRFLKILALWLVVGAMVWVFTLWHWQQHQRDVDLFDIGAYLLVLPTAIVAVWLGALWGVQKVRAQARAPLAMAAASSASAGSGSANTDESLRQAHAWVLDAALHSRAGLDPLSVWGELKSGSTRPDLDKQLQDLDGLPIFSARVPDLEGVNELDGNAQTEAPPAVAVSRALALLDGPCSQLADTWSALIEVLQNAQGAVSPAHAAWQPDSSPAYLSGVGHRAHADPADAGGSVNWSVRILMPASWSVADQDLVVCHVRSRLADLVAQAQAAGLPEPQWQVIPPATPETWWSEFDAQITRWTRDASSEAALVLAVDSALDDEIVERWQAIGELFTAHHQTGRIPGEAAAGLLVVSAALQARCTSASLSQAPIRISRPVRLVRDKSADVAGRVGATTLTEAMTQALSTVTVSASHALMIVADGDHRASRTTELFEALQAVMPGLDPMQNVARAGEALGDVGVARSLLSAALGCAAVWASEGEQVALATHVQSTHDRVVLALSGAGVADAAPA